MSKMYDSYSDEDLNDWEQSPQNAIVLTSSSFGAWLMRRDERRDKRKLEQIREELKSKRAYVLLSLHDYAVAYGLEQAIDIIDEAIKEVEQ